MRRSYDAIVVLGGGLRKENGMFLPATYEDSDEFGMLGGHMRVQAVVLLCEQSISSVVVFTSGVYEKNKVRLGADVPPEANVYAAYFQELLMRKDLHAPRIVLDTKSITTKTNIQEIIYLSQTHSWRDVAIITNEYHVPRVRTLCKLLIEPKRELPVEVLSAEAIVQRYAPGVFDEEISQAYSSDASRLRQRNEERGIVDLRSGRYADKEFQL